MVFAIVYSLISWRLCLVAPKGTICSSCTYYKDAELFATAFLHQAIYRQDLFAFRFHQLPEAFSLVASECTIGLRSRWQASLELRKNDTLFIVDSQLAARSYDHADSGAHEHSPSAPGWSLCTL